MNKYPVTSSNGDVYEVRVKEYGGKYRMTTATVYEYRNGFFGNIRRVKVHERTYSAIFESVAKEYDYVRMAKIAVEEHAEVKRIAENKRKTRTYELERFKEWDGE